MRCAGTEEYESTGSENKVRRKVSYNFKDPEDRKLFIEIVKYWLERSGTWHGHEREDLFQLLEVYIGIVASGARVVRRGSDRFSRLECVYYQV